MINIIIYSNCRYKKHRSLQKLIDPLKKTCHTCHIVTVPVKEVMTAATPFFPPLAGGCCLEMFRLLSCHFQYLLSFLGVGTVAISENRENSGNSSFSRSVLSRDFFSILGP